MKSNIVCRREGELAIVHAYRCIGGYVCKAKWGEFNNVDYAPQRNWRGVTCEKCWKSRKRGSKGKES